MGFQSEGYIINKIPKLINNSNSNYTLLEKITFNLISISGILKGHFSTRIILFNDETNKQKK